MYQKKECFSIRKPFGPTVWLHRQSIQVFCAKKNRNAIFFGVDRLGALSSDVNGNFSIRFYDLANAELAGIANAELAGTANAELAGTASAELNIESIESLEPYRSTYRSIESFESISISISIPIWEFRYLQERLAQKTWTDCRLSF